MYLTFLKNRANVAASILQNNQLLESVYESSANDYKDSAEEELSKYLDSIEGKNFALLCRNTYKEHI